MDNLDVKVNRRGFLCSRGRECDYKQIGMTWDGISLDSPLPAESHPWRVLHKSRCGGTLIETVLLDRKTYNEMKGK